MLAHLSHLLEDENELVRHGAVNAFGWLGKAAATPNILTQLAHLLHDEYLEYLRDEFSLVLRVADPTIGRLANQSIRLFSKPNHIWVGHHVDVLSA